MTVFATLDPARRFWDRHADRYAAKPVPDQAVYERKLEITRALLTSDGHVRIHRHRAPHVRGRRHPYFQPGDLDAEEIRDQILQPGIRSVQRGASHGRQARTRPLVVRSTPDRTVPVGSGFVADAPRPAR